MPPGSEKERDVFDHGDDGKSALPPLLESLAKGEKDAANMVLAYEISVNDEFELDKEDPAEDSVQGQIKSTVERAFWDVVRDNIKNGDDEMVLPMIREIREQILTFLAPNSGTRERIKGQIDIELIEQQMNSGTIDYAQLFGGLISLLGQLCSPARDGLVEKAKKETDCVSQMAHITNLLRLMRVDMTNYAIRQIRPTIQKQHVQLQREKFKQWAQGRGDDATRLTVKWLRNGILELSRAGIEPKPFDILRKCYCLALEQMDVAEWPETLVNEAERLSIIGIELKKILLIASSFLIIAAAVPRPYMGIKNQLKVKLIPIAAQTKLEDLPLAIAVQAVEELRSFNLPDDVKNVIQGQITELNEDHSIYSLLHKRAMDFLSEIAVPSSNAVPETPKGLSNIQTELAQLATIFGRVCGMNRMVFAEFYCHTIKQMLESSTGPLTPGRSQQIDDLSRSPESPNRSPRSPVTSGLTPRKEKTSPEPAHDDLGVD